MRLSITSNQSIRWSGSPQSLKSEGERKERNGSLFVRLSDLCVRFFTHLTPGAMKLKNSSCLAVLALSANVDARKNDTTTRNTTYDYIVAGAGTAGIVAAERLASSGRSVLLLERGTTSFYSTGNTNTLPWNDTVTLYDVPGMADYTGASPDLQYCRDLSIAAGCLLGGSTMLNALMFVKPRAADFANWPEEWHWENGIAEAAEEFYARQPGTILASEDGKRYDDAAFDIMSRFLDSNGWSETDALNDVESKELMYTHPPWSVSISLSHFLAVRMSTVLLRSPTGFATVLSGRSSPTPRSCPTLRSSSTSRSTGLFAPAASSLELRSSMRAARVSSSTSMKAAASS